MWFCSRQNENSVRRWLFQSLEKGIGCLLSYHVDFVYDVDLVASKIWGIVDFFPQVTNFINAPIARCIYFYYIQSIAFVNCPTYVTVIAGLTLRRIKAIHRLGQDARGAGLPSASWTAEKVGVSYSPAVNRIAQCLGNVVLPYDLRQCLGPPFAVENLRGHAASIILQVG